MLGKLSQVVNAAIFGSLAVLGFQASDPGRRAPDLYASGASRSVVRTISEGGTARAPAGSVVRTISEGPAQPQVRTGPVIRTVSETAEPPGTLAPKATVQPKVADSPPQTEAPASAAASTGPRQFSASSPLLPLAAVGAAAGAAAALPRSGDAVVPPISRKKASKGSSDETGAARKGKGADAAAKSANVARTSSKKLDTSERSALGAAKSGTEPRCRTGYQYDAKQAKCAKRSDTKAGTKQKAAPAI